MSGISLPFLRVREGPTLSICSWLHRETHAARPDQTGGGRLKAPEGPAGRAFEVHVWVVRATEGNIGRQQSAVGYWHEPETLLLGSGVF
jgi:hypothetical protein